MASTTEGIVLRRIDYSETSLVVHFYTPDLGQLAALAKGAKRPKNAFQGGLETMTRNQIVFARRGPGGLATLTESTILDDYRGLRGDFHRLLRAQYCAELVGALTTEEDPNPGLYQRLLQTLERLAAATGDPVAQTIRFEIGILTDVGYGVDWSHCVVCGGDLSRPGEAREKVSGTFFATKKVPDTFSCAGVFSCSAGGVLCRRCDAASGAPESGEGVEEGAAPAGPGPPGAKIVLPPGALAAAQGLATDARRAERLRLLSHQIRPLGRALSRYITYLLGRPPKMLKYLEEGSGFRSNRRSAISKRADG